MAVSNEEALLKQKRNDTISSAAAKLERIAHKNDLEYDQGKLLVVDRGTPLTQQQARSRAANADHLPRMQQLRAAAWQAGRVAIGRQIISSVDEVQQAILEACWERGLQAWPVDMPLVSYVDSAAVEKMFGLGEEAAARAGDMVGKLITRGGLSATAAEPLLVVATDTQPFGLKNRSFKGIAAGGTLPSAEFRVSLPATEELTEEYDVVSRALGIKQPVIRERFTVPLVQLTNATAAESFALGKCAESHLPPVIELGPIIPVIQRDASRF